MNQEVDLRHYDELKAGETSHLELFVFSVTGRTHSSTLTLYFNGRFRMYPILHNDDPVFYYTVCIWGQSDNSLSHGLFSHHTRLPWTIWLQIESPDSGTIWVSNGTFEAVYEMLLAYLTENGTSDIIGDWTSLSAGFRESTLYQSLSGLQGKVVRAQQKLGGGFAIRATSNRLHENWSYSLVRDCNPLCA